MAESTASIHRLPGVPKTPKLLAGAILSRADEIESLACVIHWKEGGTNTACTRMTLLEAVWLKHVFDAELLAEEFSDD